MKEFIITWIIENISYFWRRTGQGLASPVFLARSLQNTSWTLYLYPRGEDDSDYLSLRLRRERGEGPDNLAVNFEFSCISADTSAMHSSFIPGTSGTFENDGYARFLEPHFLPRYEVFGRRKALYLPNDILTLRCKIWKDEDEEESDVFEQIFGRTRLVVERIIRVENIYPEKSMEKTFQIESKSNGEALMSITVLYFDDNIHVRINPISEDKKMRFSTCKILFLDDLTGRKLCEHTSSYFGNPKKGEWRLPFSDTVPPSENDDSGGRCYDFITELKYSTGEENKVIENNCPVRIPEFLSNYIDHDYIGSSNSSNISRDLWNFRGKLCDVTLETQNKIFNVHKTVLCARSPVFTAMLTGGMKENGTAFVEVKDISADTLENFVFFLYTGFIQNLAYDKIVELYYAADKYEVGLLKLECCSHLLKIVSIENVCELLMLADKHNDRELKRKLLNVIWENDEKVFKSSTWKKFACEQENYEMALKTLGWKYEEKENPSSAEAYQDLISSHPKIQDDFRTLYQSQIVSDVVIKASNKTFPAHKTVLCASSTNFMELFSNKSTDFFEIEDWEDDIVSRMLLFLYTDSLEDAQWDTVIKLYEIAKAYQIQRLKSKCSYFLLENLRVSNATNLLLLAHDHSDVNLKSAVKDYICLYDEEIFGSDEWAKFSETNILLANETMRAKYKNSMILSK